MKECKNCKIEKEESDFYGQIQRGTNDKAWPYLDCYCKQCRKDYAFLRRKAIKDQAIQYLGGKCLDCGLIDNQCVFDFHHLDPTQKDIAFGSRGGKSFETLKSELDKCVLLCANCHRKRHYMA